MDNIKSNNFINSNEITILQEENKNNEFLINKNNEFLINKNNEFLINKNNEFLINKNNEFLINKNNEFLINKNNEFLINKNNEFLINKNNEFLINKNNEFLINKNNEFDQNEENINEWINIFNNYNNYELNCSNKLINLLEIKNNFKNLLGNQDKDDLLFYKSLIDNSYYYFTNSLKIRQIKFLKDINNIYSIISNNKFNEINRNNFLILIKDYKNIIKNINNTKNKSILLNWIKDDKVDYIIEFETNMHEILNYHLKLICYLSICIDLEKEFFYNK